MTVPASSEAARPTWGAWLQLLRITNLPSAWSNVLMGFLLAHQAWTPVGELTWLLLASSAFYLGGMVLNDVFDVDIDRQQRPERPIPAGQISYRQAVTVGSGLLIAGMVMAAMAGGFTRWMPVVVGTLLALSVLLYDGLLKPTVAAPWIMGGCRFLNVLLGASTCSLAVGETQPWFGIPWMVWWAAAAIGWLVTGATQLGRREAVEDQPRGPLWLAFAWVVLAMALLAAIVVCPRRWELDDQLQTLFPLVIGLLALPLIRRVGLAAVTARPADIQIGVVTILRSLIVIDASLCYLVRPDEIIYALTVLALLPISLLLGRWVRAT